MFLLATKGPKDLLKLHAKGSRKNNLADFALRFGLDLVDPIE